MRTIRIAIAQSDYTVGDIDGNCRKIQSGIKQAAGSGADIALFSELALTGYPPEDLLMRQDFIESNLVALHTITEFSMDFDLLIVFGFIDRSDDIYNSAAVIYRGKLVDVYNKMFLPNYGVFDEKRYFQAGNSIPVYEFRGARIGVNICEDLWYPDGPAHYQAGICDAELILNISASPYHLDKQIYREKMYATRAGDESVYVVNCNLTGGQDELVFDGASGAYDYDGQQVLRMKSFEEDFAAFDLQLDGVFQKRLKDTRRREIKTALESPVPVRTVRIDSQPLAAKNPVIQPSIAPLPTGIESVTRALITGTADYVRKNGFQTALIAISGGIDSALVAAIAVAALGKDRVKGIYLPSEFSADISGKDAGILAKNLGIELFNESIQGLFTEYRRTLNPIFKDLPFGLAEENLQSRIRGNLVMALSNKFGWLVLTTGNKSEMSVGYATLYGDMAGGFAVIKDVPKTMVYDVARYINRETEVIPVRIIERAPSAELRPDQKDTDSLPPYPILDAIIRGYVEEDKSVEQITQEIGDRALVEKTIRMIDLAEYKRRQSPPGIKITSRAFGRDRRFPITSRFGRK